MVFAATLPELSEWTLQWYIMKNTHRKKSTIKVHTLSSGKGKMFLNRHCGSGSGQGVVRCSSTGWK